MSNESSTDNGGTKRRRREAQNVDNESVIQSLQTAGTTLGDRLQTEADRNPWAVVGLAVAAGYVVGGGVFSPLTAKVLGLGVRLGMRLALIPMVRQEITNFAGAAMRQSRAS